jgi:hypothetical protein
MPLSPTKFFKLSPSDQFHYLCSCAGNNTLKTIPKEFFTEENISLNKTSRNLLHIAAENKQLEYIPKSLLTEKLLSTRDSGDTMDPYTVYHMAASNNQFEHIPKESLSEQALRQIGGPRYYTEYGDTVYHILASNGKINLLPEGLLTKEVALIEDAYEMTVAHYMIESGQGNLLPIEILSDPAILGKTNAKGDSILHYIYRYGQDELLDTTPIPQDLYLDKNEYGLSTFSEQLITKITTRGIPEELINEKNLLDEHKNRFTPLSTVPHIAHIDMITAIFQSFLEDQTPQFFRPLTEEEEANGIQRDKNESHSRFSKLLKRLLPLLSKENLKLVKNRVFDEYLHYDHEGFIEKMFSEESKRRALKKIRLDIDAQKNEEINI